MTDIEINMKLCNNLFYPFFFSFRHFKNYLKIWTEFLPQVNSFSFPFYPHHTRYNAMNAVLLPPSNDERRILKISVYCKNQS